MIHPLPFIQKAYPNPALQCAIYWLWVVDTEICCPLRKDSPSWESHQLSLPLHLLQLPKATSPDGMPFQEQSTSSNWVSKVGGERSSDFSQSWGTLMCNIFSWAPSLAGQSCIGFEVQFKFFLNSILLPPTFFPKCWCLRHILNPKLILTPAPENPICNDWKLRSTHNVTCPKSH